MASDNSSLKSVSSKAKTPSEGGKRVGFARPTLIIPPPQAQKAFSPYSANLTAGTGVYTASTGPYSAGIGPTPEMYGRKASMFVFSQLNGIRDFTMNTAKSGLGLGEKYSYLTYSKLKSWSRKWFTHCFLTVVLILYTVGGALTFVAVEGPHEQNLSVRDTRKDMYQLIRELRNLSLKMPDEDSLQDWNDEAKMRLDEYKTRIIESYQTLELIRANHGYKIWTTWNAIVYCATIYTSIGYGHLYPSTITGKGLTIVYALIGIPLFLIALTDFGKLFTRGIKFLWSFVRRLYYTGSCRIVRKRAHVQEIFKGAQMMYEIATFRRPSAVVDPENPQAFIPPQFPESSVGTPGEITADTDTPTTPALSNFEIDDEFNLPISVALFILISYILIGAVIYCAWEGWNFFASFYFVFISMTTIGFGDYVPRHPIYMIASIVYLVFGLALMSMCINVVQEKLSDTFKQASAKLGATIGLEVDEDGSIATVGPENVELAGVHDPDAVDSENNKIIVNNVSDKDKQS